MEKEKIILLFSDLEGTIIKEEDGRYDDEEMYYFLEQISKLQKITDAKVGIHLVSPVYFHQMEEFIAQIDKNIINYNKININQKDIETIEGAAAYVEDNSIIRDINGNRIISLKKPVDTREFDTAKYGKANYVRNWCEIYKESRTKELVMCIYCGNGQNDLSAIDYINRQNNGFAVCPKNSSALAIKKAFFISEKEDLRGITEGIEAINKEIEKRMNKEEKETEKEIIKEGEEK